MFGRNRRRILELLAEGPLTGEQIAKRLKLGASSLYLTLIRREDQKLISSEWWHGSRPRRRLYQLFS